MTTLLSRSKLELDPPVSYNLFLDDERSPQDVTWIDGFPRDVEWIVVRNFDQFKTTLLGYGIPTMVSFDHDLCVEHIVHKRHDRGDRVYDYGITRTGLHCAQLLTYLCGTNEVVSRPPHHKFPSLPERIFVHSLNEHGARRIANCFPQHEINIWTDNYTKVGGLLIPKTQSAPSS